MSKKHVRPDVVLDPAPASVSPPQADGADSATVPTPTSSPSAERRAPSPAVESPPSDSDDKYLRLAAEYDNFRKRVARERVELTARAQGDLVKTLIDSLDDLARVIAQGPGALDAKTVLDAVEVVDKKMMKALAFAGLEILIPIGQRFDPTLHEAVSTVPAESPEADHLVAQVFQPGYVFRGQLLRPARVAVKQWHE
jgi:molecular chaperone GrpE